MTWWRKRSSERDALRRALVGISLKTQFEVAVHDMRRALDLMEKAVTQLPDEEATPDGQ